MEIRAETVKKDNKKYPKAFLDLSDPPEKFYYKGNINVLNNNLLSIVGTRKITNYGERVLERFIPQLAFNNIAVVSGFMYGVDTCVHKLAVENKALTIAVLGHGINHIYPLENANLYNIIIQTGGLIISEYEPEAKPKPWMFVRRNRLIAALGEIGTLVVEADLKSGSLVTAKFAQKLNRKVYAIPGQITSSVSRGTNMLIAEKRAELVYDVSQIINIKTQGSINRSNNKAKTLSEKILKLLDREDLSVDQICLKINKKTEDVSSELIQMEFDGLIKEDRGFYIKT